MARCPSEMIYLPAGVRRRWRDLMVPVSPVSLPDWHYEYGQCEDRWRVLDRIGELQRMIGSMAGRPRRKRIVGMLRTLARDMKAAAGE